MPATTPVILHHFDESPFSEKVRIVFGLKNIAWTSVRITRIMPRPDLMPMTGGYRRTPVMQIGADIYCDSQCILRELERRFPSRPCSRTETKASAGERRCGPIARSSRAP